MTAEHSALRALHDCHIIRTRFDHPGFIGLWEKEMVDSAPVADDDDALDWTLTPAGELVAEELFA